MFSFCLFGARLCKVYVMLVRLAADREREQVSITPPGKCIWLCHESSREPDMEYQQLVRSADVQEKVMVHKREKNE